MADHESVRTTTLELRREGASLLIWGFSLQTRALQKSFLAFFLMGESERGHEGYAYKPAFLSIILFVLILADGRIHGRCYLPDRNYLSSSSNYFFCCCFFCKCSGRRSGPLGLIPSFAFLLLTSCFLRFFCFPGEPLPHWRSGSLFIWGWGGGLRNVFFVLID